MTVGTTTIGSITYTTYLISQDHLSKQEHNSYYLWGVPQPIRACILQLLSVKKPNVLPDEGYDFEDIHEAALFVLNGGNLLKSLQSWE